MPEKNNTFVEGVYPGFKIQLAKRNFQKSVQDVTISKRARKNCKIKRSIFGVGMHGIGRENCNDEFCSGLFHYFAGFPPKMITAFNLGRKL